MEKINSLTAEQTAKFPEYIDKWTRIGLSTEPADRKAAEEGIALAYAAANLPAPNIVWCSSPLAMGLTRALLLDSKFEKIIGASVWSCHIQFPMGTTAAAELFKASVISPLASKVARRAGTTSGPSALSGRG